MGTSKNYKASIKGEPQWGSLSSAVTRTCDGDDITPEEAHNILNLYFNVTTGGNFPVTDVDNHQVPTAIVPGLGNASQSPNNGGITGSGRSRANNNNGADGRRRTGSSRSIGKAGRRTARRLGGFFNTVASSGLSSAFSEIGLDITGKTVREVINYLLEYCTGVATNLDETAAKAASNQLLDQLTEGATTLEEMEAKMQQVVNDKGIDDIVINYFALYSFEYLYQMFYGKLVKEKGKSNCVTLFKNIKEFIFECLKGINQDKPLKNVNWKSSEAQKIVDDVYTKTLNGFMFYEG